MICPIISPATETICAQHLHPVFFENAFEKCKDVIQENCHPGRVNDSAFCIAQSILSDLTTSVDLSTDYLKKLANITLKGMDQLERFVGLRKLESVRNNLTNNFNPCAVFSPVARTFYDEIGKDSEATNVVDKISESVFSLFSDWTCDLTGCAPWRKSKDAKFDQLCPELMRTTYESYIPYENFQNVAGVIGTTLFYAILYRGMTKYLGRNPVGHVFHYNGYIQDVAFGIFATFAPNVAGVIESTLSNAVLYRGITTYLGRNPVGHVFHYNSYIQDVAFGIFATLSFFAQKLFYA